MTPEIEECVERLSGSGLPRWEDLIALLSLEDEEELQPLFLAADTRRKEVMGEVVHLRGIVEFSNYCERNCLYCGLRQANRQLQRYRMTDREILDAALTVQEAKVATLVLQSGEDSFYDTMKLCRLIEKIKGETGLVITLSMGERPREDYEAFREAGADRYLLKHETAVPALYRRLHPDSRRENRLMCLKWLKELGYETGTGCMVGLPGQDSAALAEDILLISSLKADMAGVGPFLPHPQTPLASCTAGTVLTTLVVLALVRLTCPAIHLPATTALSVLHPEGRMKALAAGANVVMPDFTPPAYRRLYDLYPGRTSVPQDPLSTLRTLESELNRCGRTLLI
ncbi:iron-only hydrogenase maturation protein HydE [Syntrophus gentianae]|uniref:Iron-only hydrogenase maturation protein HydE n=1 Tax=Syntrophus gentianae TaxID=43775 RepID=A0A1H7ZEA2_9BACT|nr:[FeFe] hydrogenase H-cluster radical SAM maturase HydE [Syntrophus gentianae]SEM55858.1 iron-only hydrogenase maturation protein HydE [Syntrophus gentianae]